MTKPDENLSQAITKSQKSLDGKNRLNDTRGTFSTVVIGVHRETQEQVAIKILKKADMPPRQKERTLQEIDIMRVSSNSSQAISHPHIVRLIDTYETSSKLYMILELMQGGEMFDRIIERGEFTEDQAKKALRAVVSAVAYLHSLEIVHRDLKVLSALTPAREHALPVL